MICVSVKKDKLKDILGALDGLHFAEVRLDGFSPNSSDLERIFSLPLKLIATMRPGKISESARRDCLMTAIESGAWAVDIELDAPPSTRMSLIAAARKAKCRIIISHHDYKKTPPGTELKRLLNLCFEAGADIAKIACQVQAPRDSARLLGLLEDSRSVVVVGMGPLGKITRVAGPFLGAPFTFASRSQGQETAPGQISIGELSRIFEGIGLERG